MKENRASRARRVGGGGREIHLQPGEKDPFLSMDVLDDDLDDAFYRFFVQFVNVLDAGVSHGG